MNDTQKTSVEKALNELEQALSALEQKVARKIENITKLKQSAQRSIQKIDVLVTELNKANTPLLAKTDKKLAFCNWPEFCSKRPIC